MRYSPLVPFVIALFLAAPLARAQAENAQEPRKPELAEIQPLWAPYQAALKAVAAERDKKLANLDNIYLLNLDKRKKERAEAVDLDGALAVKAEMDRLGAHQATSEEQRNSMPPALRALRGSYDAALKGYLDEAARGDQAALQKYLVDLEGLQKRITMTGDLKKALVVMAERERLIAGASNPQSAPITPEVKIAPVPAAEAVKVAPVVGSTVTKFGTIRIADATRERPFENSLGMRFVPVPITGGPSGGQRVLFSIWETRRKDFEAFVIGSHAKGAKQQALQDPSHPKADATWNDAQAFCAWLTDRERKAGRLGATESYRLPGDHEWSCAVGIGDREDPSKTPQEKNEKIQDAFPWGSDWPPPAGAGNYKGEETEGHPAGTHAKPIAGYNDGFPSTAPVGSFTANRFGLFDLGGNVWEWCEDLFDPGGTARVLRGASWQFSDRHDLLSSHRKGVGPEERSLHGFRIALGFRVVLTAAGPAR